MFTVPPFGPAVRHPDRDEALAASPPADKKTGDLATSYRWDASNEISVGERSQPIAVTQLPMTNSSHRADLLQLQSAKLEQMMLDAKTRADQAMQAQLKDEKVIDAVEPLKDSYTPPFEALRLRAKDLERELAHERTPQNVSECSRVLRNLTG
jgi:hypothetical protein